MNLAEKNMRQEAREKIIEALKGYEGYYGDLFNVVFNVDYYIEETEKAKQALKEFDVFDALKLVVSYETERFAEIYTDITSPKDLIHKVFYIIGEQELTDILEESDVLFEGWNIIADEETNRELIEEIKYLKEEE